jgi:hypothetical protein
MSLKVMFYENGWIGKVANNRSVFVATIDILISVVLASLFKKHISVSAQLRKMKMAMAREIEQEMGGLLYL